jgi:hypothetical protein
MLATTFAHRGARLEQFGAVGNHGHPHGRLVGRPLVDEALLAEVEAVVTHVNDEG